MNAKGGRVWAYIGTLMGVSVSSGANLIETLNNDSVPLAWAWVAAIFMGLLPVGLFVSLEVLVRNHIKDHINWWRAGMMLAATSFAVPSYLHMHWLMLDWGQGDVIALVYPIGWDAMMLLSTLALLLDPEEAVTKKKVAPLAKPRTRRTLREWWNKTPLPQPVSFAEPVNLKPFIETKQQAVSDLASVGYIGSDPVAALEKPQSPPARQPDAPRQRRIKVGSDPLYAEFVRRSTTSNPMTVEDLAAADGKGFNSARSKINRWRKTLT